VFGRIGQAGLKDVRSGSRMALSSPAFAAIAFIAELATIVAVAVLTGLAYHWIFYGTSGRIDSYLAIGSLAALVYGGVFLIRDEYSVESILEGNRGNSRLFVVWNMAFVALAVIGFLSKSTAVFSRGWLLTFYVAGFATVIALNAALHRVLDLFILHGIVRRRRMMIVGTEDDIQRLARDISDGGGSVYISSRIVIPSMHQHDEVSTEIIESAVANARQIGIEDVVISNALSSPEFLERCVAAFSVLPVAIHIGAGGLIDRFKDARIARFGRAATLSLTRQPLGPLEALSKRLFDIALASLALVLLAPVLLVVAALIKLDSKGPVFFRQRRRGYNLEEFAIWKFRTMTTLDDGDVVKQATVNDARVTRIGRILRKTSIDELPQLFNVISGEMSLVGPRPHAVAHDRFFEKRIAHYPRCLNVKPGITGWAQVNGLRGATETDEAMRQRVEHDLYYIDNWSVALDIYIILLTVFSRRSLRNAY
jgi:Undecaprenyl-phosphate glucose phosphotransferase